MTLQPKIDRITDILRRDDGISGAMHYTEQISWILFLKFLSDYEEDKANEAKLENKKYKFVLDEAYRWNVWACPKDKNDKLDLKEAKTGDDLKDFVDEKLFPYLKKFKDAEQDVKSVKYKIGEIFEYLDNRIASGHTLREVLDIVDELDFQSENQLFEMSQIYENLLKDMGGAGGNAGEFYTPRPLIKAIVEVIKPKAGETIYDSACGSCGFLIEAFDQMQKKKGLSTSDYIKLQEDTFYGKEKTPLAYVMGVMNMILHGIESPNIIKINSLIENIRDIQEKDRYDIILANPPFGGKEKEQIQQNFPIKSNATELLFLQHFMKYLKVSGRAAIVVPEGVLFQTNAAFKAVKKELLENFNLHTILSLPPGVFLPYSGVKTNIVFFERKGKTSKIWYCEVNVPYTLTKNKPLESEHLKDFIKLYNKKEDSENSWIVDVVDIKDYDLSAKNPNKSTKEEHLSPKEIIEKIKQDDLEVNQVIADIEKVLEEGHV